MLKEFIKAKGQLSIVLTGPDGRVRERRHLKNLVVTVGLGFIASRMVAASANVMSHMAVGTNATAPSLANTALGAEAAPSSPTSAPSAPDPAPER